MEQLKNFVTLKTIDNKIEKITNDYSNNKRNLKTTDRYLDNESERTYLLQQLEEKFNKEYDEIVDEFNLEFKVIEQEIAKNAFSQKIEDDGFAKNVLAQIKATDNIVDTLYLLSLKTMNLSETEEASLASELDLIEEASLKKAIEKHREAEAKSILKDIKYHLSKYGLSDRKKLAELQGIKRNYNPNRRRNILEAIAQSKQTTRSREI
ncbi:hypothetical protein [Paraliobacillus salinarum]|uniref:hypothetical protein n=1 Tax=Paraliobacillus salinarum TaxID=1158996 RepID=UPI0015F3888B|nr:hypothetical protein [Paraliobacillus salinarum]